MSKQANPAAIGAFVLGAVLIVIFGVTALGSGQWFTEKSEFVIYFDESVNGLSIGALVKMQGVPIGKVIDIQVQMHPEERRILTPVFIEIDHKKCKQILEYKKTGDRKELMEQMVMDGLRMQLQYTSLVTGKLYVESLFRPGSPVKLMNLNNDLAELPAVKSSSQEVQKNIADAMHDFQNIPFQELFAELLLTVKNIKQLTGSEDTRQAIHAMSTSLTELKILLATLNKYSESIASHADKTLRYSSQLMEKVDLATTPILSGVQQTLEHTDTTLMQVQKSVSGLDNVLSEEAPIQKNINDTLLEIKRSAKSLRLLTEYLEQHPEALIKGKEY